MVRTLETRILELEVELSEVRRQRDEAQREAIIWREASERHMEQEMMWMRKFVAQQEREAEAQHSVYTILQNT